MLFFGDIPHQHQQDPVALIINDCHFHIFLVLRQKHPLIAHISAGLNHFEEKLGIQHPNHLVPHDIRRAGQAQNITGSAVDLLHLQRFVEYNDAVGGIADDGIGEGFGLFF